MRKREMIIVGENLINNLEKRQKQEKKLQKILSYSESLDAICTANEIIDVNKYRHIRKKHLIQKNMQFDQKPFVFLVNKN